MGIRIGQKTTEERLEQFICLFQEVGLPPGERRFTLRYETFVYGTAENGRVVHKSTLNKLMSEGWIRFDCPATKLRGRMAKGEMCHRVFELTEAGIDALWSALGDGEVDAWLD